MRVFFFLFIALPVIELWLMIAVGRYIGALATIALVLLTSVLGVAVIRRQGLRALMGARGQLNQGPVAADVIEGMALTLSGVLLFVPGFLTDFLGLLGLVPFLRRQLAERLLRQGGAFFVFQAESTSRHRSRQGDSIEGEYWHEDDKKTLNHDRRP